MKQGKIAAMSLMAAMPSGLVPRSQDQKFHLSRNMSHHHSHRNQKLAAKIHFESPCISVADVQPMTQNEMSHHH